MCLICIDFNKGLLSPTEGWRNLQEMREIMTDEHYDDVLAMITEKFFESMSSAESLEEFDHSEVFEKLSKFDEGDTWDEDQDGFAQFDGWDVE
jgi:hypothetical protein